MGSEKNFITQEMLEVDEETRQNPLKDIDHLDLPLPKFPMKA
jgi:hypothetical protein